VGSILGTKFGARALPQKWVGVLNDRLLSSVRDCNDNKISELAARSHEEAKKIQEMETEERFSEDVATSVNETNSPLVGSWTLNLSWGEHILRVNADLVGTIEAVDNGEIGHLSSVTSEGNAVSFRWAVDKGDWDVEITFEGSITGDVISGDLATNGGDYPVSGTRN